MKQLHSFQHFAFCETCSDEGLEFTAKPRQAVETLVKSSSMELINQVDEDSERHGM